MSYATATTSMDPAHRTKRMLIMFAAALFVLAVAGSKLVHHMSRERLVIPDEKAAAAVLLEQKLSGPQYFQREGLAEPASANDGEIRISLKAMEAQVPRIVQARGLSVEQAEKLDRLVQKLAEPSPSRAVGDTTINLLRLNLALDELH